MDIGVSDEANRAPELPLYTFKRVSTNVRQLISLGRFRHNATRDRALRGTI